MAHSHGPVKRDGQREGERERDIAESDYDRKVIAIIRIVYADCGLRLLEI